MNTNTAVNSINSIFESIQGAKYLWQLPVGNELLYELARVYNLSFPVMQTLITRGFTSREALDSYLFSSFEQQVGHPSLLKDSERAVDRILAAISSKEKILICGDYDVDGITSSAMMMLCLMPLGAAINFFLPHRVHDGYGLSVKIVQKAARNNYKVLVTVDNGITAFEPARQARIHGIDLIITDHHKPHDRLPDAYAIVNPHQVDCLYPYKTLAGVGVTFKLLSLLYEKLGCQLPEKVYELLLLGTIADVVPLTGENRYWVRHGLRLLHTDYSSLAFNVLKSNAQVKKTVVSATDIGFFITPQINALGRLEDARDGVAFLISDYIHEVERIGCTLKELNQTRKTIEKQVCKEIQQQIEREVDLSQERIILAASAEWPPGIIGLVASRLVAQYNRPALLFHVSDNGIAKGSCRSIVGFNMFDVLQEHKDILLSFGGHALAAGLSLPVDKLAELKERLELSFHKKVPVFEPQPQAYIDAELTLPDMTKKILSDLEHLEPFGNENRQPLFYVKNVTLIDTPVLLKHEHVKCQIFADGIIKPVIFFGRPDIYELLSVQKDQPFSLIGYITENHWNGKVSIELQGVDIAL